MTGFGSGDLSSYTRSLCYPPLVPELKAYIKKFASLDPSDTPNSIDLNTAMDEFVKFAHLGVENLKVEQKRHHFLTIWDSKMGKSFYGKKHEYFCTFWVKLNFPVWIGVFISMFEKIIMLMKMLYRNTSKFIFKFHAIEK